MGIKQRKEREKEIRKESIIDAAEQVIQRRGFDSATMDEIAENAELGKGTLYLYFKNKSSIYLAVCNKGSKILNGRMAKVLTSDLPGLTLIRKLGETYLEFIRENPIYFNAFTYYESLLDQGLLEESPIAEECEEHTKEAMAYIVRSLQIGMQDGSIDNSYNPKELGVIIWGASKGLVHMAHIKNKGRQYKMLEDVEFSLESLIGNFIELIGSGIASKKMTDSQNIETSM